MTVRDFLGTRRDDYVRELVEFLRIPSVSPRSEHRDDMRRCAEWLRVELDRQGVAAEVVSTPGHPIVYGELSEAGDAAPTILIYGHYDVQPAEPLDEWVTPPFEPDVREGRVYARGSADDKGQIHLHLKALEAYRSVHGRLPVNVKFLLEGEEEVGSGHLAAFIESNRERLRCDACVISDTPMLGPDLPSVVIGLRGIVYLEVRLRGPRRDLHSGAFGGAVTNPANALARMIAALTDETGRITTPGFYDAVEEASDADLRVLADLPTAGADILERAGVPALGGGEKGVPVINRIWLRPALDVNGLLSGYAGEGAKTIIPATATMKVSLRLVPEQDPREVSDAVAAQLESLLPQGLTMGITSHVLGFPWRTDPKGPLFRAAAAALAGAFGREPLFIRSGGSIPIVPMIERELDVPVLLLGFALPGANHHAPNEWLSLEMYQRGIETVARIYDAIASSRVPPRRVVERPNTRQGIGGLS